MKYFLVLCLVLSIGQARAQTIDQLIEQLILDTEKLSELKTVLRDLYTSYDIINKGYDDIKHIAEGNFKLHKMFLDGLLKVSPGVQGYYRIGLIIQAEERIVSSARSLRASSGGWSMEELAYIGQVCASVTGGAGREMEQLVMTMTDGALRMSDPERLRAIDDVYGRVMAILALVQRFSNYVSIVERERAREVGHNNLLKRLYE